MNRNYNGWIAVQEAPTGVWFFVGSATSDPADLPTSEEIGTGSTALRQDGKKYTYHEVAGWKEWS